MGDITIRIDLLNYYLRYKRKILFINNAFKLGRYKHNFFFLRKVCSLMSCSGIHMAEKLNRYHRLVHLDTHIFALAANEADACML